MTLVPVPVYRLGPHGHVLVAVDFVDDSECHACGGTRRWKAWGKPVPVTVACPFCARQRRGWRCRP